MLFLKPTLQRVLRLKYDCIAGASSTTAILNEDPSIHQGTDISQGSVFGTFGELGVFGCGEVAFKTIEQSIKNDLLTTVHFSSIGNFPDFCFLKDAGKQGIGLGKCTA